jgi:hypothetical protein
MNADIFISYRHGTTDSLAAGRLYDTLEDRFAVFLDTGRQSNDLGNDFVRGIDEALASCRVLFAIIGPNWTGDEGMRRLNQEGDWVRHELGIALSHPDRIRVVPLFIGTNWMPDLSGVPADLAELPNRNGRNLNPDNWAADTQELISRLSSEWLGVKRGVARSVRSLPPVLPFLCNRSEQEGGLVDLLQAQSGSAPIACVVHGHKWEAHDEFLDRLRYLGALEDILNARDVGIAVHAIQLSHDRMREGRFHDALASALKAAVVRRRTATDDELRAFFARLAQPIVAVLQLTSAQFEAGAESPVRNLISAWRDLLRGPPDTQAPSLRYPAVLWINVTYDDVETDLGSDALVVSLPKLKAIEAVHIREWLGLDEVKSRVADRKHQLEDLAEQPRYCFAKGKLHMRRFADGVREVMSGL